MLTSPSIIVTCHALIIKGTDDGNQVGTFPNARDGQHLGLGLVLAVVVKQPHEHEDLPMADMSDGFELYGVCSQGVDEASVLITARVNYTHS